MLSGIACRGVVHNRYLASLPRRLALQLNPYNASQVALARKNFTSPYLLVLHSQLHYFFSLQQCLYASYDLILERAGAASNREWFTVHGVDMKFGNDVTYAVYKRGAMPWSLRFITSCVVLSHISMFSATGFTKRYHYTSMQFLLCRPF